MTDLPNNQFKRFDDELIDKFFNEDGKRAIAKYVQDSNKELIEKIEKELNENYIWENVPPEILKELNVVKEILTKMKEVLDK